MVILYRKNDGVIIHAMITREKVQGSRYNDNDNFAHEHYVDPRTGLPILIPQNHQIGELNVRDTFISQEYLYNLFGINGCPMFRIVFGKKKGQFGKIVPIEGKMPVGFRRDFGGFRV